MLVRVVKKLDLNLPPLQEGGEICSINPYIVHGAVPKHNCVMQIEEVEMTEEEYARMVIEENNNG